MQSTGHRSNESGGLLLRADTVDRVVDPRIGALGPALLALEDGTVFDGIAFGAPVASGGDLVVNTSYSGYQEICTDPSYAGQVVLMTYPLIGNYGRIAWDDQSERPWLRGLIVGHATAAVLEPARQLVELLRRWDVPAICGLDTRRLARRLRETGSQRVVITAPGQVDPVAAVDAACQVTRWEDQDFVGQVSARRRTRSGRRTGRSSASSTTASRRTSSASCRARRAGARAPAHRRRAGGAGRDVAGLVLSPGPGDPARLDGPVRLAQAAIDDGRPLLGICLGHQIVGRAAGAETRRLRFGHHGANHPVKDLETGRVQVTAQNHEVEVVGETLPAESGFIVSQRNLNDGSVEGLRHVTKPIETVQYHPEGSPGPLDALEVFDRFMARVNAARL